MYRVFRVYYYFQNVFNFYKNFNLNVNVFKYSTKAVATIVGNASTELLG